MKLMKNVTVPAVYPHITRLLCRLQVHVGANVFSVINFKHKSSFLKGGPNSRPDKETVFQSTVKVKASKSS